MPNGSYSLAEADIRTMLRLECPGCGRRGQYLERFAPEDVDLRDNRFLAGETATMGIAAFNRYVASGAVYRDGERGAGPVDRECSQILAVEFYDKLRLSCYPNLVLRTELDARDPGRSVKLKEYVG